MKLSHKIWRSLNLTLCSPTKRQLAVLLLFAINLPMALYMSLVQLRASEEVMKFLANEAIGGEVRSILFSPRQATPYYSSMICPCGFVDCSPKRWIQDSHEVYIKE